MTHDEIRAALSAYFDGQAGLEQAAEITAHVAACRECRDTLDSFKALSAGVKEELAVKAPAGLAGRALARARAGQERRSRVPLALALAFAALVVALLSGIVAKKYMPTMFASVQGMINGAASSLGVSSGNK
ncbi:MAG: hypothetical protein A2X32_04200 [Elusimicrobia bacterium GWC2_64_44]|nr:MAG: hypothetical protein A2X32_04200 [Elusimicrobia bacterium GWC2_64_44]